MAPTPSHACAPTCCNWHVGIKFKSTVAMESEAWKLLVGKTNYAEQRKTEQQKIKFSRLVL